MISTLVNYRGGYLDSLKGGEGELGRMIGQVMEWYSSSKEEHHGFWPFCEIFSILTYKFPLFGGPYNS